MQVITKQIKVFEAKELSKNSLEKAKQNYCDNDCVIYQNQCDFVDYCKYNINNDYGLDVTPYFSLSYSQGDGLYFACDDLFSDKVIEIVKKYLNRQEKFILKALIEIGFRVYVEHTNTHYCYASEYDVANNGDDELLYIFKQNHKQSKASEEMLINTINKTSGIVTDLYMSLCNEYERKGYEMLYYTPTDEEFIDIASENDWLFLENGNIYRE